MPGMWIANIEVTDADAYAKYLEHSGDVARSQGGRFVARAGKYTQKEGREFERNVMVEFDTFEQAVAAYESDEYQAILPLALAGSERQFVIVETES